MYQVLSVNESYRLRRRFINKFADKTHPLYPYVAGTSSFFGNSIPLGNICDVLKNVNIISQSHALSILTDFPEVLAFGDKNSDIGFGDQTAVMIDREDIPNILSNLFNTVYVCDTNLRFCFAFTGDYVSGYGNLCFTSIENIPDPAFLPA